MQPSQRRSAVLVHRSKRYWRDGRGAARSRTIRDGTVAIAAMALGAVAIGRVAIADAVIRKLRAGEIEIGSRKVQQLEVAGQKWPQS